MSPAARALLVVIDAQKAFVDPDGSVARAHGIDDIDPSRSALAALRRCVVQRPPDVHVAFVRSEYVPGQFSDGRLDHPLASVCVPGANVDCHWATGIDVSAAAWIVTKHHASAMEAPAFRDRIDEAIASGVSALWFAGFQLTTCVKATAIAAAAAYRPRGIDVAVVVPLCGVRASSTIPDERGQSRMDRTLEELLGHRVDVVRHEEPWTRPRRRHPVAYDRRIPGSS